MLLSKGLYGFFKPAHLDRILHVLISMGRDRSPSALSVGVLVHDIRPRGAGNRRSFDTILAL